MVCMFDLYCCVFLLNMNYIFIVSILLFVLVVLVDLKSRGMYCIPRVKESVV